MKQIKTWKRWALINVKGEGFDTEGADVVERAPRNDRADFTAVRVIADSDYRKMLAVYNAAIKYDKEPGHFIGNEAWEKLIRACERARK